MLLAIDVGNTQTHAGVFDGRDLTHQWRASTDHRRTSDEWGLMFGHFLSGAGLSFADVSGVAICSVVPTVTQGLRAMTEAQVGKPAVVVEPGIRSGIAIRYDNPREVGADRIANAVAAHDAYPDENVVVVDFGTATTVDVVTVDAEYLGGAIAPGIEVSAHALFQVTAQLRRVELVEPPSVIGRTTAGSLQAGIMYGTAGLVDGLVSRVVSELGSRSRVVATGGLAPMIARLCAAIEKVIPELTLLGLRIIFERNVEAT